MPPRMPTPKPFVLPFHPIERETVIEMVARRIEDLVRSGELGRGSRLPSEPRLAEMLQISRTALREALKGMVFLGLLKARPGDGTYLQPSLTSMANRHLQWMLLLQEIKYLEIYELREILEPAAAALAARRVTRDDLEQMQSALDGMKLARLEPEEFIRHEMEFHNVIMRASKNAAIQSVMQMMYGALSEGRHRVMPLVRDLSEHCTRHERIFLQIAQRDAAGARRAVIADLKYAESLLQQNLKEKVWQEAPPVVKTQKASVTVLNSKAPAASKAPGRKRAVKTKVMGANHE